MTHDTTRGPYHAAIPDNLRAADELLQDYGLWAAAASDDDPPIGLRLGGAERLYRAPANDDDARRTPDPMLMSDAAALAVQRALARVPTNERQVLAALYVPQRSPPHVQLPRALVPPSLSRTRHLAGLRMFWNQYRTR